MYACLCVNDFLLMRSGFIAFVLSSVLTLLYLAGVSITVAASVVGSVVAVCYYAKLSVLFSC